jgi:hypothetical protein
MQSTDDLFRLLGERREDYSLAKSQSTQSFARPDRMEALLQKVARFRAQEQAKQDVFLTEAEAHYQPRRRIEEPVTKPQVQTTTYERLIREVDFI